MCPLGHEEKQEILSSSLNSISGSDRYFRLGSQWFFKKIRSPQPNRNEWLDLTCEMICTWLSKLLKVPIPVAIVMLLSVGVGLVSPYVDAAPLNGVVPSSVINADKIQVALAFEEWVMNQDDKPSHFLLHQVNGNYEFFIIDHGHTLIAWRDGLFDSSKESTSKVLQVSSQYNPYGVQRFSDVQPAIEQIKSLPWKEIETAVQDAFIKICELCLDEEAFVTFVSDREKYQEEILTILAKRRERLEDIIKERCQKLSVSLC